MYHYDLYIHQYVNSALPHSVFLHLDCPTLPYGKTDFASSNSSADKGQEIMPVNLPFDRAGETGLGGG